MSFKLTLTQTLALAACLSMTACATVDLNQAATKTPIAQSSVANANVVQRAASKLNAAFTQNGFVAKTSRKRVQSTASILLKGLQEKEVSPATETGYTALATDASTVRADIQMASSHVNQTTKAAEVYLAMAPLDRSLRKELASLEKALLASREAGRVFEAALIKTGSNSVPELATFNLSVDALRDVTNEFGIRVRDAQSVDATKAF